MTIDPRRRSLLLGSAGLALAAPTLPTPALGQPARAKPDRIVVNASGGAMANIFRRTYFAEFEKLHGIRVVDTSPVDFGKLRAMVESGNPEWTVTEIGGQDASRVKQMNLVEPLDASHHRPQRLSGGGDRQPCLHLLGLFHRAGLPDGQLPQRQPAEGLGAVLGREALPRAAVAAQPPGRQPRIRAAGGWGADGQALSARHGPRLPQAGRDPPAYRGLVDHGRAAGAAAGGQGGGAGHRLERPLLRADEARAPRSPPNSPRAA